MTLILNIALLLSLTQLIQCLPFPFELGGDREEDDDVYISPEPRQWNYYEPNSRSMLMSPSYGQPRYTQPAYESDYPRPMARSRRPSLASRLFGGRSLTKQQEEDEDEKNREKVAKAIQAQQAVVETVMPIIHSIVPATTGFLGMMPRMRRSPNIDDTPDQMSMPSEQTVSVLLPGMNQPEAVAPSMVVPINYQQAAAMLVAQERSEPMDSASVATIGERNGDEGSDAEEKDDDGEDEEEDVGKEAQARIGLSDGFSLPQVIPPAFLPHPPDATVTSGDDDKIYFAVDRKTIMTFLGALFGNEMRSALAAAVHENSVHKP